MMNLIFIPTGADNDKKIAICQMCRRRGINYLHYLHNIHTTVTLYFHKKSFTIENTYENCNYNYIKGIHNKTKIFIDTHMWPTGSSTERSICACVAPTTLTSCRRVRKMDETPLVLGAKYKIIIVLLFYLEF